MQIMNNETKEWQIRLKNPLLNNIWGVKKWHLRVVHGSVAASMVLAFFEKNHVEESSRYGLPLSTR
jgi:hypothetical protein